MSMTHYMELLAVNQPWNLLIFMAGPVILAETLAIAELYLLYTRKQSGLAKSISRVAGLLVGAYFAGIIAYLVPTAVIPLTKSGEWRSWIDMVAVGAYLLGGLPMIWIALQELGIAGRGKSDEEKLKIHAICVAIFLVVAHIAMIFGMLDPALVMPQADPHAMHDMSQMPMEGM